MASATETLNFQNNWTFGKSGTMSTNPETQKQEWVDPIVTDTITTMEEFMKIITSNVLDKKYDGKQGVFLGKVDGTTKYVPSIESLASNNVMFTIQNVISFPKIKSTDDFKKTFLILVLSIMGYVVDNEVYDSILSIEFKQRFRNSNVNREIVVWSTRELSEDSITENIKKILNCESSQPEFYVSESLDFVLTRKYSC